MKAKSVNMTLFCTALAFCSLSASQTAWAGSERGDIEQALSAYDVVASKEQLLAISARAPALLQEIVNDEQAWLFIRSRALLMLQQFPSDSSLRTLLASLEAPDALLRQYAALALARGFGATHETLVVSALGRSLADSDVMVRRHSVRALAQIGTEASLSALRARLPKEPREDMQRFIQARLAPTK